MPSSMIFVSLVVLWLLILVPAVARHRQEVERPSVAALSGRVLARSPRRHNQEVDGMGERAGTDAAVDRAREAQAGWRRDDEAEHGHESVEEAPDTERSAPAARDGHYDDVDHETDHDDEQEWDRPHRRYRAGRGGFDAAAAALAARARYTFRQRVVLAMLVGAIVTGIIAAVAVPGLWWPHAAIDLMLVSYLAYLRRQVRMEETIRARRAFRMAGTRRSSAADDPELEEWVERRHDASHPQEDEGSARTATSNDRDELDDRDERDDDGEETEHRVGAESVVTAATPPAPLVAEDDRPALPRLHPTPLPPLPAGTAMVEADDAELEVDDGAAPGYRRAVGQ